MWMGDASVNPRDMTTVPFDLTLGGTICFEMRYSIQGDASPCEGPDEPTEGVYLQYSIDGGTTWTTIEYWDPNGGNDPQLVNWNQYCAVIPPAAQTTNTMIRWAPGCRERREFDYWGIDNVLITLNDPQLCDHVAARRYSYGFGSRGAKTSLLWFRPPPPLRTPYRFRRKRYPHGPSDRGGNQSCIIVDAGPIPPFVPGMQPLSHGVLASTGSPPDNVRKRYFANHFGRVGGGAIEIPRAW